MEEVMNVRKLLIRGSFFVLGIVLLAGSIWSLFSLKTILDEGTLKAKSRDRQVVGRFSICDSSLTETGVTLAQRVMAESDTQALTVSVSNYDTLNCDETISLNAPEFDVSPNTLDHTLTIPPHQKRNLTWILAPQKLGTFSLSVSLSSPFSMQTIGITVTNVFGLTIWQAQLLSYVGTFLGTFFGPVLSFTWWYTIWKKRKRRKNENNIHTKGKVKAVRKVKKVSRLNQRTKKKR
jgi:hypothetical protein